VAADRRRADDGILGEEFGPSEGRSGFTWVLDPIDGTRAFLSGATTWGTLIGLDAGELRDLVAGGIAWFAYRYWRSRHPPPAPAQAVEEGDPMFDAVGNPQSILLLGGTSEIGLAVVSEYLRRQPLRVVLASYWPGLLIVTCQVAPPLEGEMRCPGDISTIIR